MSREEWDISRKIPRLSFHPGPISVPGFHAFVLLGYHACMMGLPRHRFEVSVSVLAQMLRYLSAKGVDTEKFLASAGLNPRLLSRPDERLPIESYLFLEEEAARITEDLYFGLHMGEFVEPGSWSILGYLMMNCATLGEAFQKSATYSRIIGNLIRGRGSFHKGRARLVLFEPSNAPVMSRHCFETVLSGSVRMMRTLSGKELYPLEVSFAYPAPGPIAEYQRIFRCPVLFERRENSISLAPEMLEIPVIHPNADMLAHFEEYARAFMEDLQEEHTTVRAVTRLLLSRIDAETPSIWAIAKELNTSVRTLQSRLAEEGKTFSLLLKETREALAKKYLRENYSVEDITYLLGFSDPSVFRKAFKKWVGVTPKEYRQSVS